MNYDQLHKHIEETQRNICQIVARKSGEIVYADTWNGYESTDTIHIASVTKSITSLLIGIAINRGYIESLEQNVLDFFPEHQIKRGEKTIQQVKLRHLLTMTAPYKFKSEPWTKVCMSEDWAKAALDLIGGKNGITGTFQYSTLGIQVLNEILTRTSGKSTLEFANEFLFEPLGIMPRSKFMVHNREEHISFVTSKTPQGLKWLCDSKKIVTAGFGLCMSADELSKIGQLCLEGGYHGSRQVVSKKWIEKMTTSFITTGEKYNNMGYGYLWWIIDKVKGIFAAIGDSGNVVYINPEKDIVIAVTSIFKPAVFDRIQFVQEYIEPYIFS